MFCESMKPKNNFEELIDCENPAIYRARFYDRKRSDNETTKMLCRSCLLEQQQVQIWFCNRDAIELERVA